MVPQVSPIELSPNREALESHDPSREHPNVERIPEVTPHRVQPHGGTSGDQLPDRTDHEGEVLSPECRVRIECDCPLGSCLCPPTAFQSEGLTSRGLKSTPCPVLPYEPQQFINASGVYTSQGSSGASAPLRVWSPLARNLNPGDGVFLVWQTLTSASSIPTIITINYSSCVN